MLRVHSCALLFMLVIFFAGDCLHAQGQSYQSAFPREAERSSVCSHCTSASPVPFTGGFVGEECFQSPTEMAHSPWFVRLGVGVLLFGEGSTLRVNDTVVPGAGLEISDATTFAFDIGYQLSPVWTATFSCGVPPRLDLDGTGIFAGASYGTTVFAPVVLAAQRHFFVNPKSSIYVGAGINYTAQYETRDGLIQNLDIENDAAAVVQLGAERRINDRFSLFADAKKAFYRTQAFGSSGGSAIRSDVTVNPTVLTFGLRCNL